MTGGLPAGGAGQVKAGPRQAAAGGAILHLGGVDAAQRIVGADVVVVAVARVQVEQVRVSSDGGAAPPRLGKRMLAIVAIALFLVVTALAGRVAPALGRVDVIELAGRAVAVAGNVGLHQRDLLEGSPQVIVGDDRVRVD